MGAGEDPAPKRGSTLAPLDQAAHPGNCTHGQRDGKQEQHQKSMIHESIRSIAQHADKTGSEITSALHNGANSIGSFCRQILLSKNFMGAGTGFEPIPPEDRSGILTTRPSRHIHVLQPCVTFDCNTFFQIRRRQLKTKCITGKCNTILLQDRLKLQHYFFRADRIRDAAAKHLCYKILDTRGKRC